jgi:6-phosphofructokinase 1
VPDVAVPAHLRGQYTAATNDLTEEVLKNLDFLGIDFLIPIGGDDTLSYGVHLHHKGVKVIGIPKTMDGDVPGTDYCIGFSTCLTRTISLTHSLRTTAGSHERFLVIEVFGRYAGFTALLPTMAGAANRCVIPESRFNVEHLCELLTEDRSTNPSLYSVVLVSEGAKFDEAGDMVYASDERDMFGHRKLGGVGNVIAHRLQELSPRFNHGRRIDVISQRLSYMVRCGDPDAFDSIVPMAYGNIALDLIMENRSGRMVCLRNGEYDNVPIDIVTSVKKVVDIDKYYDSQRLRPLYKSFAHRPMFIVTSD